MDVRVEFAIAGAKKTQESLAAGGKWEAWDYMNTLQRTCMYVRAV
jgi:hypothetical protein